MLANISPKKYLFLYSLKLSKRYFCAEVNVLSGGLKKRMKVCANVERAAIFSCSYNNILKGFHNQLLRHALLPNSPLLSFINIYLGFCSVLLAPFTLVDGKNSGQTTVILKGYVEQRCIYKLQEITACAHLVCDLMQ